MSNISDRQTIVISVNMFTMTGAVNSEVSLPMNLRFAADELAVKNISYCGAISPNQAINDIQDIIQIWCNQTNDGIIGTFPNSGDIGVAGVITSTQHNEHFRLNNTFQTGNLVLQFQQTGAGGQFNALASYLPQPLISALAAQTTFGIVTITLEFLKLKNKDLY